MILYDSIVDGVHFFLGTSGFLYRSNKLMYDRATQSLWNTLQGKPVIGALAGKGIRLHRRSVVTTTWAAWRRRHPETTVLDLATGFDRDYDEGVAYRDYFGTDKLMFEVKERDRRLANKAEVIGLVFDEDAGEPSLAIALSYFAKRAIYSGRLGRQRFVALSDSSSAVRVYALPEAPEGDPDKILRMTRWDGDRTVFDNEGGQWTLEEQFLRGARGQSLTRLPSHRSFWFGWFGAHPETQLVVD